MKKITPSHIYSSIGVSLVLFLLGLLGWIMINGQGLKKYARSQIQVDVNMYDNTRAEKYNQLYDILKGQNFVEDAKLITKEEALAELSKINGVNHEELLGFNPLYTSIVLNLYPEYVNPDSLAKVEQFIKQSNIVKEVVYNKPVVSQMNKVMNRASIILAAIAGILLLSVVFLIDNTVRLSMFSNRHTIKTMQMVGATRGFIARPFDISAILMGLISAGVAIVALVGLRLIILNWNPEIHSIEDYRLFLALLGLILLLGVLISLFSTHRSVYKYLKLKVEDLY
ncbi:MAG TPA: permease-like cell division protein FtsX [Edaphocola sp.]|nr:permease-like cell division protein FtsX [Edaphocola sp.]